MKIVNELRVIASCDEEPKISETIAFLKKISELIRSDSEGKAYWSAETLSNAAEVLANIITGDVLT